MDKYKIIPVYSPNKKFKGILKENKKEYLVQSSNCELIRISEDEPNAPQLLNSLNSILIKYLKANDKASVESSRISEEILNLINHLIDADLNSKTIKMLNIYLEKFYKAIGM